jgi:MFS family permease
MGEMLGIFSVAYLAASAVGPSVSGLIFSGLGFTSTFYIAGLLALVGTVLALLVKVPHRIQSSKVAGGLKAVIFNRNLSTSALALAVVLMPHGVIHAFFPLYAMSHGVGMVEVGIYFTIYALCMGAIRPFTGALSDRIGRVAIIAPFTMLTALGIGIFALSGDLTGFLVAGTVLGLGMGAASSTLMALSVDTINPRIRGQAVAVSGTAIDTGISFGSIGMGPVAMFAGYSAVFMSSAAVVFGGAIAFLGIRAVWKKEEKVYT